MQSTIDYKLLKQIKLIDKCIDIVDAHRYCDVMQPVVDGAVSVIKSMVMEAGINDTVKQLALYIITHHSETNATLLERCREIIK